MALRPRESPNSMSSRCTAHALADVGDAAVCAAEAPSASEGVSTEPALVANSQSRWSPLWPVLRRAVGNRLRLPLPAVGRRPAIRVPIDLVLEPQHRPLLDRSPPFPAGRPCSSEYAAA